MLLSVAPSGSSVVAIALQTLLDHFLSDPPASRAIIALAVRMTDTILIFDSDIDSR